MIVELWYEGKMLDLYEGTDINHTLQINDVAEVKDRQTSYTNSFKVPKTPKNVRVLGGLGLPSSASRTPYLKPNTYLKIEGFDFLTQAWIQIKTTDDEYDIAIYSGIIEFFKKFDNKTIGGEDELVQLISEINHNKNLATVIETQNNDSLKYQYLFADFNGRTHRKSDPNVINIDYVVPSVPVSFLFEKIHEYAGYTFEGSFKTLEDYTNWFISYPKAPENDGSIVYFTDIKNIPFSEPGGEGSFGFSFNNSGSDGIKILENGIYSIKTISSAGLNEPIPSGLGTLSYNIYYRINNGPISNETTIVINENDVIDFFYEVDTDWNGSISIVITIKKLEDVNFTEEFSDLKINEFLKDVYNTLSLTPIVDNKSKNIRYLTNKERFKEAEVEDWSESLISIDKESYKFGTYGQKNAFKYKYNDSEEAHSDGYLLINDNNLEEDKTLFTSFTYSVEKELLSKFKLNSTITTEVSYYKLYEKEPQDGSNELKYKPLSKRYFYLRMRKVKETITIGSDIQDNEVVNSVIKFGDFTRLKMTDWVSSYYKELEDVLNELKVFNVTLNIPYPKLLKLDLTKILYLKQLQCYCFINKISFDGTKTTAELIKIKNFK